MASFKKSSSIKGVFKGIVIHEGMFMSEETGELVEVAQILARAYGEDTPFDIMTTLKIDEDLDV